MGVGVTSVYVGVIERVCTEVTPTYTDFVSCKCTFPHSLLVICTLVTPTRYKMHGGDADIHCAQSVQVYPKKSKKHWTDRVSTELPCLQFDRSEGCRDICVKNFFGLKKLITSDL